MIFSFSSNSSAGSSPSYIENPSVCDGAPRSTQRQILALPPSAPATCLKSTCSHGPRGMAIRQVDDELEEIAVADQDEARAAAIEIAALARERTMSISRACASRAGP